MAPVQHPDREAGGHVSSENARGRGRGRGRGTRGGAAPGVGGGIPTGSVSKIKAQIRQTKRLLAREDLTPDVRTTSERRMKTLDLELAKAEKGNLEKKMVTKYRGVRFFERKKTLRKIAQAKKGVAAAPDDKAVKEALLQARIDLYYILQYPKTQKYIALYPEGTYVPHPTSTPIPVPSTSTAPTPTKDAAASRTLLRQEMRRKLLGGELAPEPEVGDLAIEGEEDVRPNEVVGEAESGDKRSRDDEDEDEEEMEEATDVKTVMVEPPAKKQRSKDAAPPPSEESVPVVEGALTKKQKKDLKDQKRREKKAGIVAPLPEEPPMPTDGGGEEASKAYENDDFFA